MRHSIKSTMFVGAFLFGLLMCFTSCEDILGTWEKPAPAVVTPSEPETPSVAPAATITTAPTATDDVKAGSTTELVTAGVADGGTMMYKVTNVNTKPTSTDGFDATVPTAATLAAGTFYVWYYAKADATHSDSEIAATAIEVTVKIPGLLTGVFTVKASPLTKVQFSQGNLQYTKSTGVWSFMGDQWTTVETNGDVGTDYASQNVVSLFGWGTAGHSFDSGYGTVYQPWATNNIATNYGPTDGTSSLTGTYAQGDWGTNMGAGWRTLSKDEWEYLFNGRTSVATRYCKATVNSKSGVVLFPDSYTHPGGVTAITSANTTNAAYTTNAWTLDDWTKMETAGCVFLPAAGHRVSGTTVQYAGSYGRYWSSTVKSAYNAYFVFFKSNSLNPALDSDRFYGFSVRLVRAAE